MGSADCTTTKCSQYWYEDKQVVILVKPTIPGGRGIVYVANSYLKARMC
jgi:hypothetical protein